MNKKELVEAIAANKQLANVAKREIEACLNVMMETIKKSVRNGEEVALVGFGSFSKAKRAARTGINPATGEKIKIKAKSVPKFRAGKAFKDLVA